MRVVICVSLRMAASAEAPLSPIALPERLQRVGKVGRAREQACQRALTRDAHSSEATLLSLSPSHSLVMPSVV